MQNQRAQGAALGQHGLPDEDGGQFGTFAFMDLPADDLATEDIHDQVEVKEHAKGRPGHPRYVPCPDIAGRAGLVTGGWFAPDRRLGPTPVMLLPICAQVKFYFPRPLIKDGYEFSFSGLKSSVARLIEKEPECSKADVATSFVATSLAVLEAKLVRALKEFMPASLVVVGGVSASLQFRDLVNRICQEYDVVPCLPPLKWATDNAAMIALAAWDYRSLGIGSGISVEPNLRADAW